MNGILKCAPPSSDFSTVYMYQYIYRIQYPHEFDRTWIRLRSKCEHKMRNIFRREEEQTHTKANDVFITRNIFDFDLWALINRCIYVLVCKTEEQMNKSFIILNDDWKCSICSLFLFVVRRLVPLLCVFQHNHLRPRNLVELQFAVGFSVVFLVKEIVQLTTCNENISFFY